MRVRPGARSEGVAVDGDALVVSTRARALEGQANEAVCRLVADALGLPRRDVHIVHGEHARTKLLRTGSLTPQEALAIAARNHP